MNRIFLHGLGQTDLDWKETVEFLGNRKISYVRTCQSGLVKERSVISVCTKLWNNI